MYFDTLIILFDNKQDEILMSDIFVWPFFFSDDPSYLHQSYISHPVFMENSAF